MKVTSDTSNTSNKHNSDKDKISWLKESNKKEPVTFDSDKVICDISDNSDKEESDNKKSRNIITAGNIKQSCLLSRFVPECINNNKILIEGAPQYTYTNNKKIEKCQTRGAQICSKAGLMWLQIYTC